MIYLSNEIIESNKVKNNGFLAYCGIKMAMNNCKTQYLDITTIGIYLYNRLCTKKELERIKKGIYELSELNYISIISKYNNEHYCVDLSNLIDNGKYFTNVSTEEIQKINNMKINNRVNILRYFALLLSSMNWSNKLDNTYRGRICSITLNQLSNKLDIAPASITRYNKQLEENSMIYIYHSDNVVFVNNLENSDIKKVPNIYSRYKDKDVAIDYFENYVAYKCFKRIKDKKLESNKSRSFLMKYSYLCRGKGNYTADEIDEIHSYIVQYNQNQRDLAQEQIDKGYTGASYLNKIKSLDIFIQYGYTDKECLLRVVK